MPARRVSVPGKRRRPLLPPHVTTVDYKDVALLRTFLSDRGKIRARRVTGLTPQQQRAVTRAVKNAREKALLPYAGGVRHQRSTSPTPKESS